MNTINKPINSSNINQSIDDDELSNAMQKELNRQQNISRMNLRKVIRIMLKLEKEMENNS